ncbi:hypothetical protein EDD21DRAFT_361790 [Dissophora ornata]|nr:hypothetical protein EDD21DRAFT_361790 [Dissophora ornata]
MHPESGNIALNSRKMDRVRAFCETTTHPELTLRLDDVTGKERLVGASIDGLIHELVHGNTAKEDLDLAYVFGTTYPIFTTVSHTMKELRRCICLENTGASNRNPEGMLRRVEALIQEMVQRINFRSADSNSLEAIRAFTEDILLGKLNSTAANDILNSIDSALHDQSGISEESLADSSVQSSLSSEASVDLSNVLITGLTPALFLKLKPSYFAEQVLSYHCAQLHVAGDFVMLLSNPAYFMRQYPTAGTSRSQQSSLVFSMCSPHFLTVLITHHILIATQSVQSTSRRPKLLAQWIKTAQHSRDLGDLAGFMAIAIGICSPGVVRLQETWKQVPQELRLEVAQNWVPLLIKMDMITEDLQELAISSFDLKPSLSSVVDLSLENRNVVVPCVSNIKQSIDQLDRVMPSFIQSSPVPLLNIDKLEHIHAILSKAKQSLSDTLLVARAASTSPDNAYLQQYFGHLASISQTLHDQYHSNELSNDAFESSLACEPHFNGQYLDYHYKNRKMTGSFIPLMFPEAIPEKRLFLLPLLLSLENTGNTYRKSSFDEAQSFEPSTSRTTLAKQTPGLPSAITHGPGELVDSSATHHGTTNLGLSGSSPYPRSRKRTYSFPPARSAAHSTGPSGIQPMVNMTNPHLDAVASGCLHNSQDLESNEVFIAMKNVAGIGYNLISMEGGNLVLKVREENLETLVKAVMQEEDGHTADLQKPAPNWNTGIGQESSRSSLSAINGPRPAMVKAGTLDDLIHVVVMGLEDQSGKYMDEKGDMISWTSRQLTLDHGSYMKAFFATYRSFCTASRLLEQLVTMFTFAQQNVAIRNSNMPSGLDLFSEPQKTSSDSARASTGSRSSSTFEWKKILAIQLNSLRALEYWLKVHVSDFLDDLSLKAKLSEALKRMSAQEEMQKQLIGESHPSGAKALAEKLNNVTQLAVQQSMRPLDALSLGSDTLETFFGHHPSMTPQLDDACSAEQILNQMNTAAWAHFISVREHEWFLLFEVLESQSADPLGWYLPRSNATPADEDVLITNIHNTLFSIRRNGAPGTHWNGERLMSSLPLCLQNLCKLHHVIRGWVISQIASPSITYDVRLDRVQKMLDIILLSRQLMSRFGDDSAKSTPSRTSEPQPQPLPRTGVPSFVEKAIVSALTSPESRAYTRVWLELSSCQRGSVETLEDVLASRREREVVPQGAAVSIADLKLVPGIGWLIERMLETCCYVRDMSYESPQLINFDKRQYVYDLVQVYIRCQGQMRDMRSAPTHLSSWLGLSTGPSSNLSMRVIREAAQREALSQRGGSTGQLSTAGNNSGKSSRPLKIFSQLIAMQQEKMKRDQKEFEKLEKQIKDTQGRIQKAQQEQAKNLEKQIKLEQSRSRVKNQLLKSTLMRAMRPISLAITSSWSTATTTVSNATALGSAISGKVMGGTTGAGGVVDALGAHQLHIQPRSTSLTGSVYSLASPKPALVVNLINSTCSVAYTYTKRDFVFKIVTEEGGQSLLQALDYDDMLKWIKVLNEAAAEATAKRRTLLDSEEALKNVSESAGQVDEIPVAVESERKSRNSVFGVELRHLMSGGNIPLVVEKCITEIEKRGLEEVGIYRVPGAVSAINKLRLSFNSGSQNVDLDSDEWKDINVVAGALKQFLRELPEGVMTSALYDSLIAASALADYDERLLTMKDLIRTLPPPNYLLLKRIVEHLERITDYEEINHMYATNLAIVFGPTLLRAGGTSASSFATSMKNLGHQQNIVRNMILQYHWLFDTEDEEGGEEAEEEEEEEEGGLGEFPEILEDSDEEEEEEEDDEYEREEIEGDGVRRVEGDDGERRTEPEQDESEEDHVLVLTASQPTAMDIDPKKVDRDQEKNTKKQNRKTIVFG